MKSKRKGWARREVSMGEIRNAYRNSVGKSAGNTPLERPRFRWENTTQTYLKKITCEMFGLNSCGSG
jgi:hypothetical protein